MRVTPRKTFLGRQPIFDQSRNVVAYELLFRPDADVQEAQVVDGALATESVCRLAFRILGAQCVVGRLAAFVNVDAESLFNPRLELLPADQVVLEILETVQVDERVLRRCRQLKDRGYRLALDDFPDREDSQPLLDVADIVKVDVVRSEAVGLQLLVQRLRRRAVTLLAEKVDSQESLIQCQRLGFELFQGFLFGRPAIVCG